MFIIAEFIICIAGPAPQACQGIRAGTRAPIAIAIAIAIAVGNRYIFGHVC